MKLYFGIFLGLSLNGHAIADEVVIHTLSWHHSSSYFTGERKIVGIETNATNEGVTRRVITRPVFRRYNNATIGLGYKWENGWIVGGYYNSYQKPSMYVSRHLMFNDHVGVVAGLATGYNILDKDVGGVTVFGGIAFRAEVSNNTFANVYIGPGIGSTSSVAHFSVSYKIK